MSLTTKLTLSAIAEFTSAMDLATGRVPLSWVQSFSLADGSGANQANRIFHDKRQLAASANEDLDLAGVLLDAFGSAITFARIKTMGLRALSTNSNNVVIGAAASNTWVGPFGGATHTSHVRPGGVACWIAPDATGWPVTAGTGDQLRVANSGAGTAVDYEIVLIGASA